ncbi:RICIN domain-containing protein [Rhodovarius lipocyclicus]|uniref:RICIN domain-containing protein n=1 Tax=Rhodovarius lipocyclicus TaxID=268410 RepID=UPI0013593D85|nr:RICIN domain-containing protein [Rhodovarius lipocyclicus]
MNVKSTAFFGCILSLLVLIVPAASWGQGNLRGQMLVNRLSNRCLDVSGAPGTRNGAPLILYDCERSGMNPNGSPTDQMWEFTPQGFIRNTLSGRCLDVSGAPGTLNSAPLILWDCETDGRSISGKPTDQRWELLPSGHIRNRLSGRCIDVAGAPGTNNGARLQLYDCEFNLRVTDQIWTRY